MCYHDQHRTLYWLSWGRWHLTGGLAFPRNHIHWLGNNLGGGNLHSFPQMKSIDLFALNVEFLTVRNLKLLVSAIFQSQDD